MLSLHGLFITKNYSSAFNTKTIKLSSNLSRENKFNICNLQFFQIMRAVEKIQLVSRHFDAGRLGDDDKRRSHRLESRPRQDQRVDRRFAKCG